MILVTTGTNGAPFDRLLREVEAFGDAEPVFVQHGPSALRPSNATCVDYVSYEGLVSLVCQARAIVTHGGVGSILVALANGKRPIVAPRLARFGEAVDDHQLELARRLKGSELVAVVEDMARLRGHVAESDVKAPLAIGVGHGLIADLKSYLNECVA